LPLGEVGDRIATLALYKYISFNLFYGFFDVSSMYERKLLNKLISSLEKKKTGCTVPISFKQTGGKTD